MSVVRHVVVLGCTGSIGRQALEVIETVPYLRPAGLAARASAAEVAGQAARFGVPLVAMTDEQAAAHVRRLLEGTPAGAGEGADEGAGKAAPLVLAGHEGVTELIARAAETARAEGAELIVLNGVVGAAGLRATMATLAAGATLALANKESLVAGGHLVLAAAHRSGARILPVDSEHSALMQCLLAGRAARDGAAGGHAAPGALEIAASLHGDEWLVLTGSGGPFRGCSRVELAAVAPAAALRHPTWSMGPKITIDSATLMNKGLELIEAHYLFGVAYEGIRVLISPQSLVHAMAGFGDGAVFAHVGLPDMRTPIGYALTYPERAELPMVATLDPAGVQLTFSEPDEETFGCLRLARQAGIAGGGAPVVLNAANEIAVAAFLERRIGFLDIEATVAESLAALGETPVTSIDEVLALDEAARRAAEAMIAGSGRV